MKATCYAFLFFSLLFSSVAFGQTTWTGTNGTNWTDPGNWSAGVPDAADDVTIPNTANKPTIGAGTAAVARAVSVESQAVLTINDTGSLTINGSVNPSSNGILNLGTVHNTGSIIIGNISAVAGNGLLNIGIFNNNAGGRININRSASFGGVNNSGAFTNAGSITVGDIALSSQDDIENYATFTNTATGVISVDRAWGNGIWNIAGTFQNDGKITVGSIAQTGTGILNYASFTSSAGAQIQIDRVPNGIVSTNTFTNAGLIKVGANAPLTANGIYVTATGTIHNNTGGLIQIDRTGGTQAFQLEGTVNNEATIEIGSNAAVTGQGLYIEASTGVFNNKTGGLLTINRSTVHGLENKGTLDNNGTIRVGNIAAIGAIGIVHRNGGTLNNKTGGLIQIDRTGGSQALYSTGLVNNEASIKIGSNAAITGEGIRLEGNTFNNKPSGSIYIDQTGSRGIVLRGSSVFNNEAIIEIGSQSDVKVSGIRNENGTFNNKVGGDIKINRIGIPNTNSTFCIINLSTFNNDAKITIGNDVLLYVQDGIYNTGTFSNTVTGIISIQKPWGNGIWNVSGTFQNAGKITISNIFYFEDGDFSTGILNSNTASFSNQAGAEIHIDLVANGITSTRAFTNAGIIRMGENGALVGSGIANIQGVNAVFNNNAGGDISIKQTAVDGVQNDVGSTFNNNACAKLTIFDNVNNAGNFTNAGLLTVNTTQAHTNTGTFTNDGIIEYPQGNPVPSVTNNDIIVLPICGPTASPAVQIGASNSFTIGTTWYTSEALSTPAGTYTAGNNTFVASSLPAGTTRTYYLSIAEPSNACPRTVSVKVSSRPNPSSIIGSSGVLCERSTLQLSSNGGSQYSWAGPNFSSTLQNPSRPNATSAMSGTYTVSVIEWACTTSATTSVVVSRQGAIPSITSLRVNGQFPNAQGIVNVPAGQAINFSVTATNANFYSWRASNGFSSTLQNPSISNATLANQGQYVVAARNGCQFFAARSVTISIVNVPARLASAEDTEPIDMEINAYPNPVSKTLRVEVRLQEAQPLQLQLFNSTGQKSGTWQLTEPSTLHRTELDLSSLTGGVYLLEAQAGKQRAVKRVVKIQYD